MKVLEGCAFSQEITKAFRDRGHEAYSCDLLPTEGNPTWHIQDNILNHLSGGFDLAVFMPPCTHLCSSGARWFKEKEKQQQKAIEFVKTLLNAPILRIALENPIGILSTKIRKPDQIIQPWMFGHGETKATCLWLKNLPKLKPTNIVKGREQRVWKESPGKDRWKRRSKTYRGIAEAMADQWGKPTPIQSVLSINT